MPRWQKPGATLLKIESSCGGAREARYGRAGEGVITREYRVLFADGFDPIDPAPEISAEEYDNLADLTNLDR